MDLRSKIIEAVLLSVPSLDVTIAENVADRVLSRFENDPEGYINLEDDIRTYLFEIEMEKEKELKQLNSEFENIALDDALAQLKAKTNAPKSQAPSSTNSEEASQKSKQAASKHIENLEKLAALKEKGIITEEELQSLKKQL